MKNYLFLISSVILSSFFIFSCSNDNITNNGQGLVDTSTFIYPFEDGNSWNYSRTFSAENIRPDSIRHYFSQYPFLANGSVTILYDTIINGITTKCFYERYTEFQSNDSNTWHNRQYLINTDSSLLCYAYWPIWGGSGIPLKIQSVVNFEKYGHIFTDFREIFHFADYGLTGSRADDTLSIPNPPIVVMKYPIITGEQWIFRYYSGIPSMYRKYLYFENIVLQGDIISSIRTQKTWVNFDDLIMFDHISARGLLKKDMLVKDMLVTTIQNPEGVGYVDMRDVYLINSFTGNK